MEAGDRIRALIAEMCGQIKQSDQLVGGFEEGCAADV